MAKRTFTLSEQEIKAFQRAEDATQDVRELKRLQAVRLYGSGQAVQAIQTMVGCSWRALMDWCYAYRSRGLAGLKSHWQGENALKLTRAQRADLSTRLERYQPDQVLPPDIRVSRGQFWTVSDLKIVVHQWYGVTYQSDTSYRTLLHECRFSQQQTEPQYRSRPNDQIVADFEAELEKK
jgi:transposase